MARARTKRRTALVVAAMVLGGLAAAPAAAEPVTPTTTPTTGSAPTSTSVPTTTAPPATSSTTSTPTTSTPTTSTPTTSTPTTTTTTLPVDPAHPAASSIDVDPSTGLGYSQDLAIHGEGFTPNVQVGFAECEAGEQGQDGCDLSTLGFATTDANGEFSSTIRVRRFLHNTLSGTIDCAAVPESCIVSSGKLDATELAAAPLTFDPNAPLPPPPTIAADPDTGLGLVTQVHVTGSGFGPNRFALISTCEHGSIDRRDCSDSSVGFASADGNGNIDTIATVSRGIRTQNSSLVDCVDAPGCDLVAYDVDDPDRRGIAPLQFDTNVPAPPALDVTVTPATDLAHNQIVAVEIAGLAPFESAIVAQCVAGTAPSDDCAPSYRYVNGGEQGTAETALRLRRSIGPDGAPVDCASGVGVCEVVVLGFDDAFHHGVVPLDFDPAVPPAPDPTLTVVPDTDLVHKQEVQVTGTGFLPGVFVSVIECTQDLRCGFSDGGRAYGQVQPDGTIETSLAVQRGIRVDDGTLVDCVDPPGCVLVAIEEAGEGDTRVVVPLDFDESVPPPPPPEIVLDPPGPFADHQIVHLTSEGFSPGEPVNVLQCAGDTVPPFQCRGVRFVTAGPDGTVQVGLRVQRFLETFGGLAAADDGVAPTAIADCAVPGACSLVVFSFSDAFALGITPLLIDPNAPPVPPPTLVVDPSTDLEDGQVVAIHGSGFTPGGGVYLTQCRAGASDETGRACDLQRTLRTVIADNDGVVETTVTVRRTLNTSLYGTVDCATVAEGCILGWGGSLDLQFERGNVPLHFAGDTLDDTTGLPRTGSDATRLAAWGALGWLPV